MPSRSLTRLAGGHYIWTFWISNTEEIVSSWYFHSALMVFDETARRPDSPTERAQSSLFPIFG
ncbi:hypothetical protein E2C01_077229 [Portunus trituberculatus]|uniref:Uncharacterized protein n=1 Tax=Portunus trituberculatus TaxID=210409 RepID=A0A5B7ILG5_PORTR|nr:hypothetical protein [Portunus trituberculatus]